MWVIAKIHKNQEEIFKYHFNKKIVNMRYYYPKIQTFKKFSNKIIKKNINLLGDYIFCFIPNLSNFDTEKFKFIKGLNYFLKNCFFEQKNIIHFISICKNYEVNENNNTPIILSQTEHQKFKFLSGPLENLTLNLQKSTSNKIMGTINNKRIVIEDPVAI
jgi:hypothetical protein|tara:strand:- start:8218 stop:8697 length:480 start_codon:yes stop_codon:yes gene_type:complete